MRARGLPGGMMDLPVPLANLSGTMGEGTGRQRQGIGNG